MISAVGCVVQHAAELYTYHVSRYAVQLVMRPY